MTSSAQPDAPTAAAKYLRAASPGPIDDAAFEQACGVGVVVSKEECFEIASKYIASSPAISDWSSLSKALGSVRSSPELKWAAPIDIKEAVEQAFVARFGPKPTAPARGAKAAPAPAADAKGKAKASEAPPAKEPSMFEVGLLSQLHQPGGNPQTDPRLTEEHLRATGASVVTRFPPEPNGFLHIGRTSSFECPHFLCLNLSPDSKAIAVNFGYAAYHRGTCNLRYDDTNPEAEEQVYFDSILEIVRWLGFEPHLITYSSDNFQHLYELAVELIKRGKAYVCFCTGECHFRRSGRRADSCPLRRRRDQGQSRRRERWPSKGLRTSRCPRRRQPRRV